ncbi:hypothetical protein [Microvirga lenta]|uniref:hypothetical protein n=1 Tax=Microvirga lenta TaxID=2881337 RepID=UPI001CFF7A1A|nr:hypothetical protein [Microvirga lenta]MCB5177586.1 hypothetical protein [Microvirga lenta]
MAASVVRESLSFSPGRKLMRLDLDARIFLCSIGFDNLNPVPGFDELELDAAFLTVILAEAAPRPKASVAQIRDVVEVGEQGSDYPYGGHDPDQIASLFPSIRVFEADPLYTQEIWNAFFRVCLEECEISGSWIEPKLIETLRAVCELDPEKIPYKVLCRSIFDGDPTSFFLALYRCLEALYAFSSAKKVASSLGLITPWADIAAVLEDQLGWHPREEGSLEQLVRMAWVGDLKNVLVTLGEDIESLDDDAIASRAARRIYWLRNSIVHYRPAQHAVDLERFDWNTLCEAMAGIILHIYTEVFSD